MEMFLVGVQLSILGWQLLVYRFAIRLMGDPQHPQTKMLVKFSDRVRRIDEQMQQSLTGKHIEIPRKVPTGNVRHLTNLKQKQLLEHLLL